MLYAASVLATVTNRSHSSNSLTNAVLQKASSFWFWAYAATAIFGGAIVWIFGHRGVYLYDQSGVFDGAWRILQGQVIYRDFFVPYGPVVFFIQSLFFRVTGVDFSSMVLAAAVLNVVAVVSVMWLVRRFFTDPVHHPTAIAAGLCTAVWFQAPFGTLWFEQTGFCFNLIALVLIVEAAFCSDRAAVYLRMAAGCLLVVSILSKQSAGVALLPVPLGVVLLTSWPLRRNTFSALFQVLAGALVASLIFALWLWSCSSLSGFWRSVVVMSSVLGQSRLGRVGSLKELVLLWKTRQFVVAPVAAIAAFALSKRAFSRPNSILVVWMVLSYVFLQNLFASITMNETFNSVGYLGLIDGLSFGLFSEVFWKPRQTTEHPFLYWMKVAVPLFATALLFYLPISNGWFYSAARVVQQFDADTRFVEALHVRRASRLIWAEPKVFDGRTVSRKQFEDLNAWLDDADRNFFVLCSATLLYGLHQRVSPQPWVYLTPDHSFRLSDIAQVDTTVVQSLKKNNVRIIVWEKSPEDDSDQLLKKMPELEAWLLSDFHKEKEFGFYEVWTLRAGL
jgi:4-amino-4-deoxy-L-arabinose transferase-like glycosyltransferase